MVRSARSGCGRGRRVHRYGAGQHQVGPALVGGQQFGLVGVATVRVAAHRQPAQHVADGDVVPLGEEHPAIGQLKVGRHGVAERGGDEAGRRDRRLGQHGAVAQQPPDPVAQALVEHPHHDAQPGVDLLGQQRGVDVARVVLRHERERGGMGQVGLGERLLARAGGLHNGHSRQRRRVGPLAVVDRRPDDRDVHAVPVDELVNQPEGERVVAAHDAVPPGIGLRFALAPVLGHAGHDTRGHDTAWHGTRRVHHGAHRSRAG
jgi:hypothetical protein